MNINVTAKKQELRSLLSESCENRNVKNVNCICLKSQTVKCECRELTTSRRFICPITAVVDGVTYPRGRDTLPLIATELVRRACTTRCSTAAQTYIHVQLY